jgi:hypothetical protein
VNVSPLHLLRQRAVIASLGEVIINGVWQSVWGGDRRLPPTPGPEIQRTVAPIAESLVVDFVRASGGDPAAWRGMLPPHLFPHWSFPLVVRALAPLPFPLWRSVNLGARMTVSEPLPLGEPLTVSARLERITADERRVIVETRVVTSVRGHAGAITACFLALVPLASETGPRKPPEVVPAEARELDRWRLGADAGLDFALLTGDFNPIHWLPPYARVAGFRNVILHGFGSMARAVESVVREELGGDGKRLGAVDVRFTKPLVLPADVGLFSVGDRIFVGDRPGAPAALIGSVKAREKERGNE